MPLMILVPVLLDTVVARPVRSCPRQMPTPSQQQLPVRVVQLWANMDLLKTMILVQTVLVLIVMSESTAIQPGLPSAKPARLGNTKKKKDK